MGVCVDMALAPNSMVLLSPRRRPMNFVNAS